VAALNAIAEPFEESVEPNEEEEARFFLLTPIKHLWVDALLQFVSVITPWNFLNEFTSLFEDESFVGHLSFFVHAFGMAATTAGCVGELDENYRVLATGIILAKMGLLIMYLRAVWCAQRTRMQVMTRCGAFAVNILLVSWGMQYSFERFRVYLIAATVWDWCSILLVGFIKKENRLPLHIQSYADRIKEVTMVIFGEAIFAIILQPHSEQKPETHFYLALATTLWMIYSMALQEFHIVPNEHDHALRRSLVFGFLWSYTEFFKQVCLLAFSIGIKRAHLLMFKAPLQPIDQDTRNLLVWGLSTTIVSVILIRSYSFGFGRHPSKDDTPELYWLKTSWWACMVLSAALPQIINHTILEHYSSRPHLVLVVFGGFMALTIMGETAVSNVVADHVRKQIRDQGGNADELTYLNRSSEDSDNRHPYNTSQEEGEDDRVNHTCAFPTKFAPPK